MNIMHTKQSTRGFSVVELMVAMAVGLLAMTFATRMLVSAEQNKASSLGGSDQMQNGMLALFSINEDAAQAGWGLNDELLAGCNTTFTDTSGYTLAVDDSSGAGRTPLAPVIIQNSSTASDTVSLYAGTSQSGVGSVKVRSLYAGADTLDIDTQAPFGFAAGDAIVVATEPSGGNCALAQLSADPLASSLQFSSGDGNRFNSGSLGGNAYAAGQARVFNLGPARNLSLHTWTAVNGVLTLRASNLEGAATAGVSVVGNIVALKAQYGFDTRAAAVFDASPSMQVLQWSNVMIDADGVGGIGSAGDYRRVAAIRVAIVARSAAPEKSAGRSGVCSATTAAPQVFATASPSGVTAVPVTAPVALANDPFDWKCYRYRVFESIVPIRNSGWRPT